MDGIRLASPNVRRRSARERHIETPKRSARSTRVSQIMKDHDSDVEFIGDSPAPSGKGKGSRAGSMTATRRSTRTRTPRSAAVEARGTPESRPRSILLGVFIPKIRPSQEMIADMRAREARLAAASGSSSSQPFQPSKIANVAAPTYVVASSEEDEEELVEKDLGALPNLLTTSNGASSNKADKDKGNQKRRAATPTDSSDNDLGAAPHRLSRKQPPPAKRKSTGKVKSAATVSESDCEAPRCKSKGEGPRHGRRADSEDDSDKPRRKSQQVRRKRSASDDSDVSRRKSKGKSNEVRRRRRDSFGSDSDSDSDRVPKQKRKRREVNVAETEDEEDGGDIELDEPDRFKTKSRLREVKLSAYQSKLHRLQKLRRGKMFGAKQESSSSSSSEEEESESSSEDDRRRPYNPAHSRTGPRAGPSRGRNWKYVDGDLSDFIADDDDVDGRRVSKSAFALPEEFSLKRESPEYKFNVVFQYLVTLVVRGPGLLPLKPSYEKYFGRQLRDVRNLMIGLKNRVASAVWKAEYLWALKKYPDFHPESYCNACNRSKQSCEHEAYLRGTPYDPHTHGVLPDRERERLKKQARERRRRKKQGERVSSHSDTDDPRDIGPIGNHCLQRTSLYHQLHHWEHKLFKDIRTHYHDLLRAKNVELVSDPLASADRDATDVSKAQEHRLQRKRDLSKRRVIEIRRTENGLLPADVRDADEVTEWMDRRGYQTETLKYLGQMQKRVRDFEGHQ